MKPFLIHKTVKKGWVWLKRFRHRKGYGVHSPFAYNFITRIIYGKLSKAEGRAIQLSSKNRKESRKVMALLHKLEKEASTLVYINLVLQQQDIISMYYACRLQFCIALVGCQIGTYNK